MKIVIPCLTSNLFKEDAESRHAELDSVSA